MVGLLDLRTRGQSDVTSAERRGVFGDLRLSRFLQSGKEKSQYGWCVVSSFAYLPLSLSLSLSQRWSSSLRSSFFFFWSTPLSRNLSFIVFLSSDRIKLGFLCFFFGGGTTKVTDWPKNYFWLFSFFDKFHRHFAMRWSYAQKPLFPFWRKSHHW